MTEHSSPSFKEMEQTFRAMKDFVKEKGVTVTLPSQGMPLGEIRFLGGSPTFPLHYISVTKNKANMKASGGETVSMKVLKNFSMSKVAKPPKHPDRVRESKLVSHQETKLFDHLKKNRLYKMTWKVFIYAPKVKLYREPSLRPNLVSNDHLESGRTVMYLGRVVTNEGLFHKVLYGDQVGWVLSDTSFHFQKYTKRKLERMERYGDRGNETQEG